MTEPESIPAPLSGFATLGLSARLLTTLSTLGYEEPTPIQREAIPPLLLGRDLLGQAGTGTGKTAAFALPMLQRLADEKPAPGRPLALVLVPTRELAMQVAEAVHKYGRELQMSVLPIYGGQSFGLQLRGLARGVSVIVATPGRALDHLERGTLHLDALRMVVLDEADEMLDMGFAEDLESILKRAPESHQTALFSATLPPRILAIAEQHLENPLRISIARERTQAGDVPRVRQVAYLVQRSAKHAALGRVLDMETCTSAIVFCRTRIEVDELTEAMNSRGYRAEALHGGFSQEQRDRVMKRFRSTQADLLIATDVAARGLDIDHVSHVVNYDVPTDPDTYVHRIGRTGRAGREGAAITFAEPREQRLLRTIQHATQQRITMATLPTVADLRHRRLELTKAALKEAVVAGDLERFRSIALELSSELDPMDVAAAAVKLYHETTHAQVEANAEEKDAELQPPAHEMRRWDGDGGEPDGDRRGPRGREFRPHLRDRGPRPGPPAEHAHGRDQGRGTERGFDRGARPRTDRAPQPGGWRPTEGDGPAWDRVRLFVGLGRDAGLRPGDLVGAIANEAGIDGRAIGSIEISDRFSLVEVPAQAAEQVIRALRFTTLRGRKVQIRRDRGV